MSEILTAHWSDISELIKKSRDSERKRAFKIIRSADSEKNIPAVMLNAFQPGTYVQPHKHPTYRGKEVWTLMQGGLLAVLFDDDGNITEHYNLSSSEFRAIEIPSQTYHTAIAMEDDSVMCEQFFDVYQPDMYKQFAEWEWAPPEGDPRCEVCLNELIAKVIS